MVADDKPTQLYDTQANTAPPTRPQLYGGALPSISQSHVPQKMSITDQLYNAAATAERNSKLRPLIRPVKRTILVHMTHFVMCASM